MEDRSTGGTRIRTSGPSAVGPAVLLNGCFLAAGVLTILLSVPAVRYLHGAGQAFPLTAAWIVALFHGAAAFLINNRAIRLPAERFFIWGVGMNGLRVLGLLALFMAAYRWYPDHFRAFLTASMIGYFCFLFCEIWNIHRATGRT